MSAEPQLPHTFFTTVESSPVPKHHPGPVCTEFTVSDVVFVFEMSSKTSSGMGLAGNSICKQGRKQSIVRHGDLRSS